MEEFLPVLLGMVVFGLCHQIGSVRFRGAAILLLSLFGGALATTINGEWGAGPVAMLIDTILVAAGVLAAGAGLAILGIVRRRLGSVRLP
jgi:hypothetical protein